MGANAVGISRVSNGNRDSNNWRVSNSVIVTKLAPASSSRSRSILMSRCQPHQSTRRNATRSVFSSALSLSSKIRLKNSTVSSSVSRRPS